MVPIPSLEVVQINIEPFIDKGLAKLQIKLVIKTIVIFDEGSL